MRQRRDSKLSTVISKRDIGAHIELLPKSSQPGLIHLAHNQMLKPVVKVISKGISSSRVRTTTCAIVFVKAGEYLQAEHKKAEILATTQDWQLLVDLEKQLSFPLHIVSITLRPDSLLVSEVTKNITTVDLTEPWKDHMKEAHERKRTKYGQLVIDYHTQGWKATFFQ